MNWVFTYSEALLLTVSLLIPVSVAAFVANASKLNLPGIAFGAGILVWFIVVFQLARIGIFEGGRRSSLVVLTTVTALPVGAGVLWLRGKKARALLREIPTSALVALQTYRIVALVFLVALLSQAIPAAYSLPVAVGDTLVGTAAPVVAYRIGRLDDHARAIARAWNWLGISFVFGAASAAVIAGGGSTFFVTVYPFVLFPAFIAPFSLLLHTASLIQLRR